MRDARRPHMTVDTCKHARACTTESRNNRYSLKSSQETMQGVRFSNVRCVPQTRTRLAAHCDIEEAPHRHFEGESQGTTRARKGNENARVEPARGKLAGGGTGGATDFAVAILVLSLSRIEHCDALTHRARSQSIRFIRVRRETRRIDTQSKKRERKREREKVRK